LARLLFVALLAAPAFAGPTVTPWSPPRISSDRFESHPAFDPVNGDLYFVRSTPQFSGWRLFTSRCGQDGWGEPASPSFAGDGVEADPWFTADGRTLYFISTRTTDGVKGQGLDLWRVERAERGWGTPVRLPAPLNSRGNEWFPHVSADGWLYFGSDRPGGLGRTDIWRARETRPGHWAVENLGAAINTPGDEYEPLPSPDGARLIVMAEGGLYESRRDGSAWGAREKLAPEVNVTGSEIGALFSPSGRSLLFARNTGAPRSGELFVLRGQEPTPWPPECPAK
jgi:hypothetical protein